MCGRHAAGIRPHVKTERRNFLLMTKGAAQVFPNIFACSWKNREVAVKVPRLGTGADLERFRKEVTLMAELGGSSTHIMPLLGRGWLGPMHLK
jgi:hypothetical protein